MKKPIITVVGCLFLSAVAALLASIALLASSSASASSVFIFNGEQAYKTNLIMGNSNNVNHVV